MNTNKLSFNQITADHHSLEEVIQHCQEENIQWLAPWRHKIAETGLAKSARLIKEAGMQVSSLCRGGMFSASSAAERQKKLDDNKRAIEETATLGGDTLVLVCGPAVGQTLAEARHTVEVGIESLIPYAKEANVTLGIEPLHPMFTADRSVIVSLGQANDITERLQSSQVGVIIDVYHVWWDPHLYEEIERSSGHIFGYHVNDWITLDNPVTSRGIMGDGVIELQNIRHAVEAAGYHGPIEAEILNDQLWQSSCQHIVKKTKEAFTAYA